MADCKIITQTQQLLHRKKYEIIAALIVIISIKVLLKMYCPIYEINYMGKLGISFNRFKKYTYVKEKLGEPVEQYEEAINSKYPNKELVFQYESFLYITDGRNVLRRIEITGDDIRFGKNKIGVGSSKQEVIRAYRKVRKLKGCPDDIFGVIDGINKFWVQFEFDSQDIVKKIIITTGV